MAFTMSVPMAAWMRYRGHGWAPVWEMTASMFVPSVAAIALLRWADDHELELPGLAARPASLEDIFFDVLANGHQAQEAAR